MERATRDFAPSDRLLEIAEEFVNRVRNRESPTVEEYIERFPETAEEIRRYLPMLVPASSAQSVSETYGSDFPIPPPMLPTGVSRYHVQTLIGSGSMGAVYQARDLELDRVVGLKIPQLDHRQSLERFYREARAMATVDHRNVCSVFDVGQFEPDDFDEEELKTLVGKPYLTMAFIEGTELSKQMTEPWDQVDAAKLVAKIATALQVVHDAGVVHRDVKPGNIIMDSQGEPVITDFGLARRDLPEEVELTVDGQIIGSPAYMSPEQINGRPELGPQADIYSLGVMLYEMLCGRRPFTGSPLTLLRDICWKEATHPNQFREDLDPNLESICLRAIDKDLSRRYQNASDLANDLNAYLDGRYVPPPEHKKSSPGTWLLWLGVPIAALLAGLMILKPAWLYSAASEDPNKHNDFALNEDLQPKMSREEFRKELHETFFDHFEYKSYVTREPDISKRYANAFAKFGISPESTSANALKVFMDQQPPEIRTDILVGLESWLLCMQRESEDVPVPWLRTQLEANHAHHSPLRTALLEMDEEKFKVLTKQFAIKHFDPRLAVIYSLYMKSQDKESALWLAQEADKAYPENAAILATIGMLEGANQHRQIACEALERAGAIEAWPQLYARLSLTRSPQKKYDLAIEAAKKAIELDPDYGTAYFALSKAYFLDGQTDEAAKHLPQAIDRNSAFLPQAQGYMARALVRQGKYEEAMEFARKAFERFRANEVSLNQVRLAQDMLNEFESIDEHQFRDERFELSREFVKGASKPIQYRRLRPYLFRLRSDLVASDDPNAKERIDKIKKMLMQVDRFRRGRK